MAEQVRIKGIRCVGPLFDQSGYAAGMRRLVLSLYNAKVPIWVHPITFEKDKPEVKKDFEVLDALCRTQVECDINLVRLSPEVGVKFLDPNMVNILHTAWETSHLHPFWVECCNKFDAILVESDWSVAVFKESGVTVPIFCTPNYENVSDYKVKSKVNSDLYRFYSIIQWTERKNGVGLLKAYFNAFTAEDKVQLVLKTYVTRMDPTIDQAGIVKSNIETLKKSLNLDYYPPILLITDKLTDEEIIQMHEQCDCYVHLDRGESWGIPLASAAAAGNPIIATAYGGTRQFLGEHNSYCVPYQLDYVENMVMMGPFYKGNQLWAQPNTPHASQIMRWVFKNREEAFAMGKSARASMEKEFNESNSVKSILNAVAGAIINKRGHL